MQSLRVTVAVPTWNRCQLLEQALEAMTALRTPTGVDWSVLVVNNNSKDDTPGVLESFRSRLPLRWVCEEDQGASAARNRALREVDTDYVLWTDDDVLVEADWLTAFSEATGLYPEAAVFGGTVRPWFPVDPDPLLMEAFPLLATGFCATPPGLRAGPCGPDVSVFGANMAFKLASVVGLQFNRGLGGVAGFQGGLEDLDFITRVRQRNGVVVWCPDLKVRHYVLPERMTLRYLTQFYADRTRTYLRHAGVPETPMLFGLPRFALRNLVEHSVMYGYRQLTGDRLRALIALRECHRDKGYLLETIALHREARRDLRELRRGS
jgi:glucosyl-dolichyl phosphate glucuronosyltransferase